MTDALQQSGSTLEARGCNILCMDRPSHSNHPSRMILPIRSNRHNHNRMMNRMVNMGSSRRNMVSRTGCSNHSNRKANSSRSTEIRRNCSYRMDPSSRDKRNFRRTCADDTSMAYHCRSRTDCCRSRWGRPVPHTEDCRCSSSKPGCRHYRYCYSSRNSGQHRHL